MIDALLAVAAPVDAAGGIDPGTVERGQPIAPDTSSEGLPILVEWFTFEPSGSETRLGAAQVITIPIRPDAGASPGRYTALLTAAVAAVVGAAVVISRHRSLRTHPTLKEQS